jgi:hypothetical protein
VSSYAASVSHRVPWSAALLRVAGAAVRSFVWSTSAIAFVMLCIHLVYIVLWSFAVLGVIDHFQHGPFSHGPGSAAAIIAYACLFMCLIWTRHVMKHMIHVVVTTLIATWWKHPLDHHHHERLTAEETLVPHPPSPPCPDSHAAHSASSVPSVGTAFQRAWSTLLGSISLASFPIIVGAHALYAMLYDLVIRRRYGVESRCCTCLPCLFRAIEHARAYVHPRLALVYLGMYPQYYGTFTTAAKAVDTLVATRGFHALFNSDVLSGAMNHVAITIGVVAAGLGWLYTYLHMDFLSPSSSSLDHSAHFQGAICTFLNIVGSIDLS